MSSIAKKSRQPSDLDKTITAVKVLIKILIDDVEELQERVRTLEEKLEPNNKLQDISELQGEIS